MTNSELKKTWNDCVLPQGSVDIQQLIVDTLAKEIQDDEDAKFILMEYTLPIIRKLKEL